MRGNVILATALIAWLAIPAPAEAQQQGATGADTVTTLTPMDYIEIRQLAARYGHAVDTAADNGQAYASLFAPDAIFGDPARPTTGRESLAALARRTGRGPQTAWHYIVNHVIEPTPEGAVGKQYLVHFRYGDPSEPNGVFGGGHYDDVYVKTPEGWRFKSRRFIASQGTPASLAPAGTSPDR